MSQEPSASTVTPRSVVVGVVAERPGEQRTALVPDGVRSLGSAGVDVLVESGAGTHACATDADYEASGARVASRQEVLADADIVVCVHPVEAGSLHPGQLLVGLVGSRFDTNNLEQYARQGVTLVSLDEVPRTVSSAQAMDALTSQANLAGYKAVLVAAATSPLSFPLLMTAAGTLRPAVVLVLGAGVAGLQAIATAARLGAVVRGYDVRPEAQAEIESLGAKFVTIAQPVTVATSRGYAGQLAAEEAGRQQAGLAEAIGRSDVVITTAQVPGRNPPLLVTDEALAGMRSGSVVVDLAASDLGGNVAGSVPEQTITTANDVTVIGARDLASTVPVAASSVYSHNIVATVDRLLVDGAVVIDHNDPVQAAIVLTHDHQVLAKEAHDELQPVR